MTDKSKPDKSKPAKPKPAKPDTFLVDPNTLNWPVTTTIKIPEADRGDDETTLPKIAAWIAAHQRRMRRL